MEPDFDVDAMLEDAYIKGSQPVEEAKEHSPEKSRSSPRHKSSRRSRSREKKSKHHKKHHSHDRTHSSKGSSRRREHKRTPTPEPTPEERDSRTIFCMQLGPRVRERDIEDFFYETGKIRDVRLITDSKTRRSKGIAYIEFGNLEAADNAVKMSGQRLCGRPVVIQYSQAEKNRTAMVNATNSFTSLCTGPIKLYMSSIHHSVTDEMLESVFTKYGRVNDLKIVKDHYSGKSLGYGYVTFASGEDARKAIDQLNGYDLAGVRLRMSFVNETPDSRLDLDQSDRGGVELGVAGKLQLMHKLAEGTGMSLPENASNVLRMTKYGVTMGDSIETPCLILMSVFDYSKETQANWADDVRDDIIEECDKFGGCVHMFIEIEGGNVYVKCPTVNTALSVVKALHGRFYGGRSIVANFIPQTSYHTLFPEAIALKNKLKPASTYENNSFKIGNLYKTF